MWLTFLRTPTTPTLPTHAIPSSRQVVQHLSFLGYGNATTPAASSPAADPAGRSLRHYVMAGGEHSEAYWGARFNVPMAYLYPPTPTSLTPAWT